MRIIGIDYGRKRIGIAVSDLLGYTAQSLPTVSGKNKNEIFNRVIDVCKEYAPSKIILGLPLNQYGKEGDMAKEVRTFGELLNKKMSTSIEYFDERFTSKQAERTMIQLGEKTGKNKGRIDSLSAVFLLQSYLDLESIKKTGPGN